MVRNYLSIIGLMVLSFTSLIKADNLTGSIEGTVVGRVTQQPLQSANITILHTSLGTASNEKGQFALHKIPVGSYQIKVSMMGYQPVIKTKIEVCTNRTTKLEFEMLQSVIKLNQPIEVTAGYFREDPEKPVSTKTLSSLEIRSSPGSGEDIFRVLQSMPGVTIAGARSANLIVRGGDPNENLTLLDNIEIQSPLHFSRQDASMGIISIITPSLIKNIEFITGGFPAQYGDKMSSVFEINLKEGNRTQLNQDIDINLGGFYTMLDGPVSRNSNIIFSLRRGIFDLFTRMMNRPVLPRYWDLVGKYTIEPTPQHRISFLGFYYRDNVERNDIMNDHGKMARKYPFGQYQDQGHSVGINWRYLVSFRGYGLTTLEWNGNTISSILGKTKSQALSGDEISENRIQFKTKWTYEISNKIECKTGLFYKTINTNHHTWRESDTLYTGTIVSAFKNDYHPSPLVLTGSFFQTMIRPISWFSLNMGIRYTVSDFSDESYLSPRLSLRFKLREKITLNGAFGHYYQTPTPFQIAQDKTNIELRSSRADHLILGIDYLIRPDTKISMELYNKDLNNLITETDTSNNLSNEGSGFSRGIEFNIQKKMVEKLMGSLAYTWSISKRKDSITLPEYLFDYDRPHNVTLITGYKLSNNWQIGLKFQYSTGNPHTPIVASVKKDEVWYVVEGQKNSARYPDFHKLDIRIDHRIYFPTWTLNIYLDTWNIYNQKNILSYYYEVNENGKIAQKSHMDFPVMPILGISAQF